MPPPCRVIAAPLHSGPVFDDLAFVRHVQDCLGHLHDVGYLGATPVARAVVGTRAAHPGDALRRALIDAIEQVRPPDEAPSPAAAPQWRRHRLLSLRCLDGLTLYDAARTLAVSP